MAASITVNLTVNSTGAQPTPPSALWANLITLVASVTPDYTILPAGLIEDLASTATYAIALIDSACVEFINSLDPGNANQWLLVQLGNIYGVSQAEQVNGSVLVVFSGTVGFQIVPGFTIGDNAGNQYTVQEGAVIGTGGTTPPVFCLAINPGIFPIPANSVTTVATTLPVGITCTCTNPLAGTPSLGPQTEAQYRSLVMAAGLVSGQGNASMVKTLLAEVPGVQPLQIACKQVNGGGWEVICGGGDPYQVANAIFQSGLDISTLVGSTIGITGITNANPGVVTTNLNHGLITGQNNVHIAGVVGMTGVNGGPYTVTVLTPTTFSFGVNTTTSGTYTSGGVVTPNARNVSVNLNGYPDTYTIPFVVPPAQTVLIGLTWNTTSVNFVSNTAVQQLGAPAIAGYLNNLPVGAPINLFILEQTFVAAVVTLFNNNPALISKMIWTVTINGVVTAPVTNTFTVFGDPESYFTCNASTGVTITQA